MNLNNTLILKANSESKFNNNIPLKSIKDATRFPINKKESFSPEKQKVFEKKNEINKFSTSKKDSFSPEKQKNLETKKEIATKINPPIQNINKSNDFDKNAAITKTYLRESLFALQNSLKPGVESKKITLPLKDTKNTINLNEKVKKVLKEPLFTLQEIDSLKQNIILKENKYTQDMLSKNKNQKIQINTHLADNKGDYEPKFDDFLELDLETNASKPQKNEIDYGDQNFKNNNKEKENIDTVKNQKSSINKIYTINQSKESEFFNSSPYFAKKSSEENEENLSYEDIVNNSESEQEKNYEDEEDIMDYSQNASEVEENNENQLEQSENSENKKKSNEESENYENESENNEQEGENRLKIEDSIDIDADEDNDDYLNKKITKINIEKLKKLEKNKILKGVKSIQNDNESENSFDFRSESHKKKNFMSQKNLLNLKYYDNQRNNQTDYKKEGFKKIVSIKKKDFEKDTYSSESDNYNKQSNYNNSKSSKNYKNKNNENQSQTETQEEIPIQLKSKIMKKPNLQTVNIKKPNLQTENYKKNRSINKLVDSTDYYDYEENNRKNLHNPANSWYPNQNNIANFHQMELMKMQMNNLNPYLNIPNTINHLNPAIYYNQAFVPIISPPHLNPFISPNNLQYNYNMPNNYINNEYLKGNYFRPNQNFENPYQGYNNQNNQNNNNNFNGFLGNQAPIIINNNLTSPNKKIENQGKESNFKNYEEFKNKKNVKNNQQINNINKINCDLSIQENKSEKKNEKKEVKSEKKIETLKESNQKTEQIKEKKPQNIKIQSFLKENKSIIPKTKEKQLEYQNSNEDIVELDEPQINNLKENSLKKPQGNLSSLDKESKSIILLNDAPNAKSLAEIFLEKKKKLAEKLKQKDSEKIKEKDNFVENNNNNKRSKEEILKTRKEIMSGFRKQHKKKSPEISLSKVEINNEKIKVQANDELLKRLAMGIKPKISKKEMYALTNKNYFNLEENKKKREENMQKEKKKEDLKMRKEKVKELDEKVRKRLLIKKQ